MPRIKMSKFLLVIILAFSTIKTLAQVGESSIAISTLATDSIGYSNIGKTGTPKCARPGPCESACAVYTFIGEGDWNIEGNWEAFLVPPAILTGCFEIVINPANDGECILNTSMQMLPPGSTITISAGKRFRVPGAIIITEK